MKTLFATIVATVMWLIPGAASACPCCDHDHHSGRAALPATASAASAQLAPGEARVTIPVVGMHCGHCASRVEAALARVEGVRLVDARLDPGEAVVVYDKSKVEASRLVEAIDALGFKAGTPARP